MASLRMRKGYSRGRVRSILADEMETMETYHRYDGLDLSDLDGAQLQIRSLDSQIIPVGEEKRVIAKVTLEGGYTYNLRCELSVWLLRKCNGYTKYVVTMEKVA